MASSNVYLVLLRGINVGGKSLIKMADLRDALTAAGFENVQTYIQSGNIMLASQETDTLKLAESVRTCLKDCFALDAGVVVLTLQQWQRIVRGAPEWWGKDDTWKHNLLVMLPPYDMKQVRSAIGVLKPGIEEIEVGDGVLYQSMSKELFGRTTTGKLASNPVYKQMTVRNYNTATKLLALLESASGQ